MTEISVYHEKKIFVFNAVHVINNAENYCCGKAIRCMML